MSYYISKGKPIYKEWQFHSLSEGIDKNEWLPIVEKFENLKKGKSENRYNLYSVQNPEFYIHMWQNPEFYIHMWQNPEFYIHMWQNPETGNAITFPHFPDRFIGEFVKYIKQIIEILNADFYFLNNEGNMEEFDFSKYDDSIKKNYFLLEEEKITNIEVSELIGLITIQSTNIDKISKYLNLQEKEITTWEDAVQKCYDSEFFMIREVKEWIVIIGKFENLIPKLKNELSSFPNTKNQIFPLLQFLSNEFGQVGYNFNASKYGCFENYVAQNGRIIYQYIHEDGDEEKIGELTEPTFNDFLSLCYDKSILDGVKIYK